MKHSRVVAALLLLPSLFIVGGSIGGIVGGATTSGMGWDRLADTLGGIAVGALAGIVVALIAARAIPVASLRPVTLACVFAALCATGLKLWRRHVVHAADSTAGGVPSAMPTRPVTDAPPGR